MRSIQNFPKILLCTHPIDFRKRRKGLAVFVQSVLSQDPFSTTLFLFSNRRRDCVRALYWDRTGFAMWEKELEEAKFHWPKKSETAPLSISIQQAEWLLDGVDIWKLKPHAELHYSVLC